MTNYINRQSFKCLLGKQSKDIKEINDIFTWKVGKKQHFVSNKTLTIEDLSILQPIAPSNFHYLSETNMLFLKQHFKVDKVKNTSIIINIEDLSFKGNQYKSIRHCLNRCQRGNFSLETNYKDIGDVERLIEEWSNDYTLKYFRDNSGKNMFFYKNNFHQDLISLFIYKEKDLVAFGTLSKPNIDGYSSYVLGKALFKRCYGLSEFADVELYKLGQAAGIRHVNLGQASKGLLAYKTQFPHMKETHYDGSIKV
jgi:hypothetical protein